MVQWCGVEQWGKIWPSDKLCVTGEQICWSATSKMLLLIEKKKNRVMQSFYYEELFFCPCSRSVVALSSFHLSSSPQYLLQ